MAWNLIPGVMYPHHLPQEELCKIRKRNEKQLKENNLMPISKQELKEMYTEDDHDDDKSLQNNFNIEKTIDAYHKVLDSATAGNYEHVVDCSSFNHDYETFHHVGQNLVTCFPDCKI